MTEDEKKKALIEKFMILKTFLLVRLVTACNFGAFIAYFVGTCIVFKEFANIIQGGICDIGKSLVG